MHDKRLSSGTLRSFEGAQGAVSFTISSTSIHSRRQCTLGMFPFNLSHSSFFILFRASVSMELVTHLAECLVPRQQTAMFVAIFKFDFAVCKLQILFVDTRITPINLDHLFQIKRLIILVRAFVLCAASQFFLSSLLSCNFSRMSKHRQHV